MIPADTWQMLDRMGFNVLSVLLSILWQSTIVLAAAAALALLLRRRRASVRHALWVAALLAIPLLPLLGWLASSVQAPQAPLPVMPAYSPPPVAVERPAPAEQFIPPPAPIVPAELPQAKTFNVLSCPWALGLLAYAAGAGALLVLVIVGRIRIAAWLRKGQVVTDGRAIAILHAARQRLGLARDFTLVESPAVLTPVTVGVLHPAVLLPQGFAQKLSDEDLESVAIHELAHIKRRDPLLLALLSLVRAAFFFHPLVWLGCRQASTLAEAACDDAVLEATGQPLPYAKMLARLAEELPRRALATELAAGFVLSRGAFLRRIEAILSPRRDQIRRLSRLALALTLVAAIVSVGLALALPLGEKPAGPDADKDAAASAKTGVPPSENALPRRNSSLSRLRKPTRQLSGSPSKRSRSGSWRPSATGTSPPWRG